MAGNPLPNPREGRIIPESINKNGTKPQAVNSKKKPQSPLPAPFLPDFCSSQSVFLLVLVAEVLALLLTLADYGLEEFNWDRLALISVQIQWVVILSAICLCRLKYWLGRQSQTKAGLISYTLVLSLSLLTCILGQWGLFMVLPDQSFRPNAWQLLNNFTLSALIAGIWLRYLYLHQQLQNQRDAETQARIQALQSRIRPHFLFNSMNSIASLIASAPETAERVVENLSDLFRASLAEPSLIPLERELMLCRQYLDIEQLRLDRRLQVDWHIAHYDPRAKIPSLMLQPLMENAIFHGIEPLPQGGTVRIRVTQKNKTLSIVISNPYPLVRKNGGDGKGRHNSMALENIRRRLQAHFGSAARLSSSAENGVFTTYIFCPITE